MLDACPVPGPHGWGFISGGIGGNDWGAVGAGAGSVDEMDEVMADNPDVMLAQVTAYVNALNGAVNAAMNGASGSSGGDTNGQQNRANVQNQPQQSQTQVGCAYMYICAPQGQVVDPTTLVAADPNAPASFSIVNSGPDAPANMGLYTRYNYQLNNSTGQSLTGPGYSASEFVSPNVPINSNGFLIPLDNGLVTDNVGFSIPPTSPQNSVSTQTFIVLYQGQFYSLSTVFQHQSIATPNSNGCCNISNSVTVIVP